VTLEAGGYLKEPTTFEVPAFVIAKYPITNAQFTKFIEAGGYQKKEWWTEEGWQDPHYNGAVYPVIGLSWFEVVAFCWWLSEASKQAIMLPTEQQWQRAAQGDDGRTYPWGNEFDKSKCNSGETFFKLDDIFNDGQRRTTPVTQYPQGASPYGVLDMVGNNWEYCITGYKTGSLNLDGTDIPIVRGGSRVSRRDECRVACRSYGESKGLLQGGAYLPDLSFRVACSVSST
jgi:formylglycine-generating enzyme required for sulfatase activity